MDLAKFRDMKQLLGMCVDNTMQIEGQVSMAIKINEKVQAVDALLESDDNDRTILHQQMQEAIAAIRDKYGAYQGQVHHRPKIVP